MTLRIIKRPAAGGGANMAPGLPGAPDQSGDNWGTRIAKLVPAEALGLYGSAIALAPKEGEPHHATAQWIIVLACIGLILLIRLRGTADAASGSPQYEAVAIAVISFLIWLLAIGSPTSPFPTFWFGSLLALLWGSLVPYFYKGS